MKYGGGFSDAYDQKTIAKSGKQAVIKIHFRKWQARQTMAGQEGPAREVFTSAGRKASSKGKVSGWAGLRIGGFQATRSEEGHSEEGHGRAGMEAQRFHKMAAAMVKCSLPRWSFCIFSISRARDHAACMLERHEVRPGLLLPTCFFLTQANDRQPRAVVSNLTTRSIFLDRIQLMPLQNVFAQTERQCKVTFLRLLSMRGSVRLHSRHAGCPVLVVLVLLIRLSQWLLFMLTLRSSRKIRSSGSE